MTDGGPFLPGGSGGEYPPEEPWIERRMQEAYNARMWLFIKAQEQVKSKRRRAFSDYTSKNCEEAYGGGGWET